MRRIAVLREHLGAAGAASPPAAAAVMVERNAVSSSSLLDVKGAEISEAEFDFIVVGGGSAGCVVASRLSEDPDVRVLLLEAGGTNQVFKVRTPFLTCPDLQNSEMDWAFRTEPQVLQQGRPSYWPRGKVLGGSSSINFMLYVRPDPRNFTEWVEKHGCEGWSYEECLPFMKKSENYVGPAFDPDVRGKGGPLTVTDNNDLDHLETNEVIDAFVQGCKVVGIPITKDYNSRVQTGASRSQTTIKNGNRCDTASAFLFDNGAVKNRRNLTVVTHAHVTQVLTIGGVATGVSVVISPGGVRTPGSLPIVFRAKREVILCGGAVSTPHLLMLSGIGPKQELEKHGVPVAKDLPGVGKNLKDHIMVAQVWSCKPGQTNGFSDAISFKLFKTLAKYAFSGKGLFTTSWVQGMAFLKSKQRGEKESNDLQIHLIPLVGRDDKMLEKNFGLRYPDHGYYATGAHLPEFGITLLPSLLQPFSKGEITLKSANPFDHPRIEPAYLSDSRDLDALVDCFRKCREVARTKEMQTILDCELIDKENPFPSESDDYIKEQIKKSIVTIYHPTSTTKMGPSSDPTAVVDPSNLKVHGFANLRIADCGVCPDIVSANTNAVAILIGERCADFVKKEWKMKTL